MLTIITSSKRLSHKCQLPIRSRLLLLSPSFLLLLLPALLQRAAQWSLQASSCPPHRPHTSALAGFSWAFNNLQRFAFTFPPLLVPPLHYFFCSTLPSRLEEKQLPASAQKRQGNRRFPRGSETLRD